MFDHDESTFIGNGEKVFSICGGNEGAARLSRSPATNGFAMVGGTSADSKAKSFLELSVGR
jgi:hypothetical protein